MRLRVTNGKNPKTKGQRRMTAILDAIAQVDLTAGLDEQTIPDAIRAQALELDDLRAVMKVQKEREEVLRAALLDFLETQGEDSVAEGGVSITRSTHDRKGIDRARMEALYPKVLADVTTTTPVVQVRVKIKG